MTIGSGKRMTGDGGCSVHGCVLDAQRYIFPVLPRFTQLVEAVGFFKHDGARWLAAELCAHDQEIRKQLKEIADDGIAATGRLYHPINKNPYAPSDHPAPNGPDLWVEFSWERMFIFEEPGWTLGLNDAELMGEKGS